MSDENQTEPVEAGELLRRQLNSDATARVRAAMASYALDPHRAGRLEESEIVEVVAKALIDGWDIGYSQGMRDGQSRANRAKP